MVNVKTAGSRLLAAVMAVCLAAVMAFSATALLMPAQEAHAATANQNVLDQRSGVFKFNWGIDGYEYARGSAFMINDEYIVTAYHCVMPSSLELEYFGLTQQDVLDRSTYTVTITGNFQVGAELYYSSETQDLAILKLDTKLNNVKILELGDSSKVDASEQVYSLGFPVTGDQNAVTTFTSNDVTVVDGTVSKPEGQMTYWTNTGQWCEGTFLMTTCRIEGGSSGGPMVDADGKVIGISVASDSSFYYAASSSVLLEALDMLNIVPKPTDPGTTPPPTPAKELDFTALNAAIKAAEALDASQYSEASYKAVTDALAAAKDALNTEAADPSDAASVEEAQKTIDAAAEALTKATDAVQPAEKADSNLPLIIGIIVAVIVIIAIIAIILAMRGKKNKQAEAPTVPLAGAPAAAPAAAAAQPALQSGGAQSWQKPGAAAGAGAAETTILQDEATDTVILFQAASGGSLTRMSTNEQIPINSAEFTIGRERSKVNYCLEGNSSISRVHVRIVVRDGKVYCIDNKAANGTYINGVKCRPGEEVLLKSGDIITLADEKFKYNA